ncbi:MAG: Aconitate hydratase A [Alphaproteobacteria bacterium MarineAlpha2_Bin1]|nr:MAG: Aconitate hydratase A [Alphaproteobacteria bacterium MarineAlpha2_Bin1]
MISIGQDTFKTKSKLSIGSNDYFYFSLKKLEKSLNKDLSRLPFSLKVILENLLRFEDGKTVFLKDIRGLANWGNKKTSSGEISYRPARVLMQDFTGVPAVVDLAAMRDAMNSQGGNPDKINPLSPVDLVIDHSVMVDNFGDQQAFKKNVDLEYIRNIERYEFLKWGQAASTNFRVVPPGTGICHQVNLEYLAKVVWSSKINKKNYIFPDTLVGTDSHTTMINGLAVLGWGVGGIEAEAAMLGQPISMLVPDVVGCKLIGKLREGTTATDLVLTITEKLRKKGVVGKFVEFFGKGLNFLTLADRATISNMAPEYGATCGFFPVDNETIDYLKSTARPNKLIKLVEKYYKAQGMWRFSNSPDPVYSDVLEIDISSVQPSLAGPKRPQDRVLLSDVKKSFRITEKNYISGKKTNNKLENSNSIEVKGHNFKLSNGDVVIAAITSCTNTSNPAVMLGAGLLAKNAINLGLKVKPWVKTSLAPGSKVVTEYLRQADLQKYFNKLGFNLVGYGCTTCIGNSGPLSEEISSAIIYGDLITSSVLSGNRNFEGRVSPLTRTNYLASPILVVAYAIAGNVNKNLLKDPIGINKLGEGIFLKDIWPNNSDINKMIKKVIKPSMFKSQYKSVFEGDSKWKKIKTIKSKTYNWSSQSTYVKKPPYFENIDKNKDLKINLNNSRILALLGDSITTDHISPAGAIKEDSPAGKYLRKNNVKPIDFNSYGSRRGNHEVMMRGTFANIRLRNEMVPNTEGGYTIHYPSKKELSIYDAAMEYKKEKIPLIVIAGKEYGTGSSRDWAAKGTSLLGVSIVLAESFERIHRSNLVGMGVMPLQFIGDQSRKKLSLNGDELIDFLGLDKGITPSMEIKCKIKYPSGKTKIIDTLCRIDTSNEVEYFNNGGILHFVLRNMIKDSKKTI